MRTEAAVLIGAQKLELQEFTVPEIGADEGILEIEASGVCGSDMEPFLNGGAKLGGPRVIRPPVILGHEMVGRIAKIGSEAARRWNVQEGDRVVVERWMPCRRCHACLSDQYPSCYRVIDGEQLFYGGTPTTVAPSLWGGFARHMYLHPDSLVHRVSAEPPASVFAMFLPLGNAVSWVQHTGQLGLGEQILIQGPGPIGLLCVLVARAAGARTIIVSGLDGDERRLSLARELGATHTINASEDDIGERCREISGSDGVDLVVDVTNARSTDPVVSAIDAARPYGRLVLATDHPAAGAEAHIVTQIHKKTLTVSGVRGRGRKGAAVALDLLADPNWTVTLKRLCDPIVALEDIQTGFEALRSGQALHASMTTSLPAT
jgi:threonine dehydrogenase-like Zn-dependent dehydrogenase